MVCLRSKAPIVSAENSVGLLVPPLGILVSAIMPEPGSALVSRRPETSAVVELVADTTVAGPVRSIAILQALLGSYICADPWSRDLTTILMTRGTDQEKCAELSVVRGTIGLWWAGKPRCVAVESSAKAHRVRGDRTTSLRPASCIVCGACVPVVLKKAEASALNAFPVPRSARRGGDRTQCHVGRCSSSRRTLPCLNPRLIPNHAVLNHRGGVSSFLRAQPGTRQETTRTASCRFGRHPMSRYHRAIPAATGCRFAGKRAVHHVPCRVAGMRVKVLQSWT